MKIYDISQEVFSCEVYPGDPKPRAEAVERIREGSPYNLSSFSMCAHNGTHLDAPFHFLDEGDTVEQIPLESVIGDAFVVETKGSLRAKEAEDILRRACSAGRDSEKRILLKGDGEISLSAAEVFAEKGVLLIGTEKTSVGQADAPMAVHKTFLEKKVVILEGLRLGDVSEGVYFLNAAPLCLAGFDGAPCRAVLIEH